MKLICVFIFVNYVWLLLHWGVTVLVGLGFSLESHWSWVEWETSHAPACISSWERLCAAITEILGVEHHCLVHIHLYWLDLSWNNVLHTSIDIAIYSQTLARAVTWREKNDTLFVVVNIIDSHIIWIVYIEGIPCFVCTNSNSDGIISLVDRDRGIGFTDNRLYTSFKYVQILAILAVGTEVLERTFQVCLTVESAAIIGNRWDYCRPCHWHVV